MEALTVSITVRLGGDEWVENRIVPVPPDYQPRDIVPFIEHETDKALSALQREAFGYSRSERIIRQLDRRLTVIGRLLRMAPHDIRRRPVVERVREVIDMDSERLLAEYGDENVED
jgi:hypothetical protein